MKKSLIRPVTRLIGVALIWSLPIEAMAAADPPPANLTIATWNVEWFFDDYPEDNYSDRAERDTSDHYPVRAECLFR